MTFVERLEPSTRDTEDADTARLVTRFQAGDQEAFTTLYTRYFERVYGYLRVALRSADEAEDATQQVFVAVFEALPRYERRELPFRSWLFTIVRNTAIKLLRDNRRLDFPGEEVIAREAERTNHNDDRIGALDWIADRDLLLFVERLPLPQRQVLMLRFGLGLSTTEVANILDRSPEAIRAQQSRALRFLRQRLAALGRDAGRAKGRGCAPALVPIRQLRVIRERRFGLLSPGPT